MEEFVGSLRLLRTGETNLLRTFKEQNLPLSRSTFRTSCHGDLTGISVTMRVHSRVVQIEFAPIVTYFLNKTQIPFDDCYYVNSTGVYQSDLPLLPWLPGEGYYGDKSCSCGACETADVLSLSWKLNNLSWKHPSCRQDV